MMWRIHGSIENFLHQQIWVDLCGPFKMSKNGNVYIAIAVDAFSKFVEAQGKISKSFKFEIMMHIRW